MHPRTEAVPYRDLTPGHKRRTWVGKPVHDIVSPDALVRVWLIEANTSAPHSINVLNIVRTLDSAETFESPEAFDRREERRPTWVALLEMHDGSMVLMRMFREWAELSRDGNAGVFRRAGRAEEPEIRE